eukprot:g2154.t1
MSSPEYSSNPSARSSETRTKPGSLPPPPARHGQKKRVDISSLSRRCEADGCAKWPLYGNEGEKAKFCSFHKSASMIDVRSRRCAAPGCKRQPSYAVEGKRAAFCAAHKEEGMVDVVSRRCEQSSCRRRPLYGYEGQRSQFCSAHKKEGQVDVCNRRCARPGCSKRPCFGLPGQRPTYCGSHRSPEMVDVISRKCGYPGCSRPTGHEAGRVRSRFCDKHKSAALVGASLLQLAGTTAEDSAAAAAASPGETKVADFSRPPPTLDERTGAPRNNIGSDNPGLGGMPEDSRGQRTELAPAARTAVPEVPSRRATYNATLASTTQAPAAPEPQDHPRRRATMPAPLLPSVQSLLTSIPPGRLKRPRVGDADDPSRFSLRAGPPSSSSSSPREQLGGIAETCLGGDIGSTSEGDQGEDSGTLGKSTGVLEGIPTAVAADMNSGGSDRQHQQPGDRWAERRGSWDPNHRLNHGTPGFVASAPVPEWRRLGLASMGRAASYDEAAAALRARGLHPQAGEGGGNDDPSKPRRSSAFVSHGSALPPVVTEMGRRDSAFEPRALAPAAWRRVPHYSDLLSARAPSRAVTTVNGHPGYHAPFAALRNTNTMVEEGGGGGCTSLSGDAGSSAETPGSRPPWNAPTPGGNATLRPGLAAGAAAAGAGRGGRVGGIPPPTLASRAAARMFHVMPATAAFTAGLAAPSPGAEDPGGDGDGDGDGARRLSVTSRVTSEQAGKEVGSMVLVPAWGAPAEQGKCYGGGGSAPEKESLAVSSAGVISGGTGTGAGRASAEFESSHRQPRRGSMAPGAARSDEQAAEARRSSVVARPGGGVMKQEELAEEGPRGGRQKESCDAAGSRSVSGQGDGARESEVIGSRRGSVISALGRSLSAGDDVRNSNGDSIGSETGNNMLPPTSRGSAAAVGMGDRRRSVKAAGAPCAMSPPPPAPVPSEARRGSVVGGVGEPPGAMEPPSGKDLSGVRDALDERRGFMAMTRRGEVSAEEGRGGLRSENRE